MQGVDSQWNGSLAIDGVEVPLHPTVLGTLNVINSIHQHLPSLQVAFKDVGGRIAKQAELKDGAPIDLVLGDGGWGQTDLMRFVIQGDPIIQGVHDGVTISFSAILDNVQWLRKIVSGSTEGTSGDAIAKVASEAGLTPDVHSTSDKMIWLPNNKPLAAFARHVMERGWASATSCMMLGVSDDASLRYHDIDRIVSTGGQIFGVGSGIPILQQLISSKSQLYNNVSGYGSTSISMTPDGLFKELNKIDVRMIGNSLAAAARTIGLIGDEGGRIEPRALDVGNTHEKWSEAMHQNRRIRSTYAHDVHILIDKVSKSKLLDPGTIDQPIYVDGDTQVDVNGEYIITAFTRSLAGNRYLEKLTLTNQSG